MIVTNENKYSFRDTTMKNHALVQQLPDPSSGRKILPLEFTPSLVMSDISTRVINTQISETKEDMRLLTYYINAKIETILEIPLKRGKTDAQGSQAKKGWQAAHSSFYPKTEDSYTKKLISKINEKGVSPTKTKEFLVNRLSTSSPERKILHEKHKDSTFVHDFVLSRLPKGGDSSVLAGTRYYYLNNTTFENPDESNQYDSRLEAKIGPTLRMLQTLRLTGTVMVGVSPDTLKIPKHLIVDGKLIEQKLDDNFWSLKCQLSAEDSLEWLVGWLLDYYQISIDEITEQLKNIDIAHNSFEKMRTFEKNHLENEPIGADDFKMYLSEVDKFLLAHKSLTSKKKGCATYDGFKSIRNDFSFLKKLQKMSLLEEAPINEIIQHYNANKGHLKKEMIFDIAAFHEKYSLYLEEAKAQRLSAEIFTDPCVIPNLATTLFGIFENGKRRAPTEKEIRDQVFKLMTIATPERIKIKRPLSPPLEKMIEFKENIESQSKSLEQPDLKKFKDLTLKKPIQPRLLFE